MWLAHGIQQKMCSKGPYTTGPGEGGGHSVLNGYPLPSQTVTRGGGSERQNLGVVIFFGDKKGGSQLQTKNMIGTVDSKLYSLYFIKYMVFFI